MVDFARLLKDKRAKDTLEKQLAKATKSSAPSMHPTWTPHKKKEEEPPPPSIDDLNVPPADRIKIRRLIGQHATITKTQSTLKKTKARLVEGGDIKDDEGNVVDHVIGLKQLCKLYGLDKFMVGENKAVYYTTTRKTINMDKLLAAGVSPAVILKCTDKKTIQQFKVSGPDTKGEEGEEWD